MPETPDNTNVHDGPDDPEKRKTLLTLGVWGAGLIGLALGVRESCGKTTGVSQLALEKERRLNEKLALGYLGKWMHSDGEVFTIQKTNAKPSKKIPLSNKEMAKLMLPVKVDAFINREFWIFSVSGGLVAITPGGIYNIEGKHAIIVYCTLHEADVLVWIRKAGKNIQLGFGDDYISAHDALQTTHTKGNINRKPIKWRTYKPIR